MKQEINLQNSVRKIRDRYKPLFCSEDFYFFNQKKFAMLATKIVSNGKWVSVESERFIVTTLFLSLLRRTDNWFGGVRKNSFSSSSSPAVFGESILNSPSSFLTSLQMQPLMDALEIRWSTQLDPAISVYEFLKSVKIKAIPDSVFWSLHFLSCKPNLLLISKHAPTPYELLKIQACGQRVITFEDDYQKWPALFYDHRDVLSFWLHDLVHAAEFFQNEEQKNHQIYFYRWMLSLMSKDIFSDFLQSSENRTSFEYLISDMNSHPLHLIKTLRAILDRWNPKFWEILIAETRDFLKGHSVQIEALEMINLQDFNRSSYDAMLHALSLVSENWAISNRSTMRSLV